LKKRAEKICHEINLDYVAPVSMKSTAGGGSTPNISYNSFGIAIKQNIEGLDIRLRQYNPPIIVRRTRDKVILDLSAVLPAQDVIITKALQECLL